MKRFALTLCVLAACSSERPWKFERLAWEHQPQVTSRSDARDLFDRLSAKKSLTLDDCYQMAIYRSESLALEIEELVRLQVQYDQAVAAVLPRITFKGSYTRQEDAGGQGASSAFRLPERTEWRFNARQPIFSGLREFYAIRQAGALVESRDHEIRHARLLLYADVASAFYSVLQTQRDLETTRDTLRLAQERLDELAERHRLNMSRKSELLAQEAEVASIRARVEELQGALAVAWEALKFLTGLGETRELVDTAAPPDVLPPVETLVARALQQRSDVKALQKQIAAAEESVAIARAGYLPSVTLESNYYTHREGITQDIDWDVTVSGEIPIFEGGATGARIAEARSSVRQARLQLERLTREIALQVNRAYADVRALQSELTSLEKAVASAQENYEIVQAEYRQNIVTNIEVLASFNTLQRARLERDQAGYQLKLAAIRLAVSSGSLP